MGLQTEGGSSLASVGGFRLVAERHGQRFVIVPHATPGIGDVVVDPVSPRLIPGVEVEPFVQWRAVPLRLPGGRSRFCFIGHQPAPSFHHKILSWRDKSHSLSL